MLLTLLIYIFFKECYSNMLHDILYDVPGDISLMQPYITSRVIPCHTFHLFPFTVESNKMLGLHTDPIMVRY